MPAAACCYGEAHRAGSRRSEPAAAEAGAAAAARLGRWDADLLGRAGRRLEPDRRARALGHRRSGGRWGRNLLLHRPLAHAQSVLCVPPRLPLAQGCRARSRAPRPDGAAGGCGRRLLVQDQQGGRSWGASADRRQERA